MTPQVLPETQELLKMQSEWHLQMTRQNDLQEAKIQSELKNIDLAKQQLLVDIKSKEIQDEKNTLELERQVIEKERNKLLANLVDRIDRIIILQNTMSDLILPDIIRELSLLVRKNDLVFETQKITLLYIQQGNEDSPEIQRLVELLKTFAAASGGDVHVGVGGTNIKGNITTKDMNVIEGNRNKITRKK